MGFLQIGFLPISEDYRNFPGLVLCEVSATGERTCLTSMGFRVQVPGFAPMVPWANGKVVGLQLLKMSVQIRQEPPHGSIAQRGSSGSLKSYASSVQLRLDPPKAEVNTTSVKFI